jgi:DNA-binding transcriptional LysR family regulator
MIDLQGTDLNLLVSLDVLIEEANVTRAAARLNISQPALSAQLTRLRDLFRDPLLVPSTTGRGMIPTARALQLRGPLHVALKDLETVVKRPPAFDPLTAERVFAIAASDHLTAVLGTRLIERVHKVAAPGVRVSFRTPNPDLIAAQLERGQVDLLIANQRNVPSEMKSCTLYEDRHVMAQRKGHPRGTQPLDLDTYCGLSHVLVSHSGSGSFQGISMSNSRTSAAGATLLSRFINLLLCRCSLRLPTTSRRCHRASWIDLPINSTCSSCLWRLAAIPIRRHGTRDTTPIQATSGCANS